MKPMLFNTEMVRAILNGTKNQTRRVVKPYPEDAYAVYDIDEDFHEVNFIAKKYEADGKQHDYRRFAKMPCWPGDIIYVREAWAAWSPTYGTAPTIHYKADNEVLPGVKWHPSIHMSREAARLFLRVMDVRVERLQEISDEDIVNDFGFCMEAIKAVGRDELARPFWDSTIKLADRHIYGWDANPWVFVTEFERISKQEAEQYDQR